MALKVTQAAANRWRGNVKTDEPGSSWRGDVKTDEPVHRGDPDFRIRFDDMVPGNIALIALIAILQLLVAEILPKTRENSGCYEAVPHIHLWPHIHKCPYSAGRCQRE